MRRKTSPQRLDLEAFEATVKGILHLSAAKGEVARQLAGRRGMVKRVLNLFDGFGNPLRLAA